MAKKQKKQPKKVQHTTVETAPAPAPKPKFDIQNFILNQTMSVALKKLLDNFDWDTFIAFIVSIVN